MLGNEVNLYIYKFVEHIAIFMTELFQSPMSLKTKRINNAFLSLCYCFLLILFLCHNPFLLNIDIT